MSEKPSPRNLPSSFLSAAMSILFGCIALYLAIQLLRPIATVLVTAGAVVFVVQVAFALRRTHKRGGDTW